MDIPHTGIRIWQAAEADNMWIVSPRQGGIPLNITRTWAEAIAWAEKYLRVENGA